MMTAARRDLLTVVGFQVVWLACALGAAADLPMLGVAAASLLLVWHLAASPRVAPEVALVLLAGAGGVVGESLLVASGAVAYASPTPRLALAPLWIVALWLAFATTIAPTERMLGRWPLAKAAVFGALLGPLAYVAGARLGALTLPQSGLSGYLPIALVWGIAMPALMAARRHGASGSRL